MDGHFVPNIVLGAPILSSVKKAVPNIFMDVRMCQCAQQAGPC
jgi:ribulose-phosphate 3-epimerase